MPTHPEVFALCMNAQRAKNTLDWVLDWVKEAHGKDMCKERQGQLRALSKALDEDIQAVMKGRG